MSIFLKQFLRKIIFSSFTAIFILFCFSVFFNSELQAAQIESAAAAEGESAADAQIESAAAAEGESAAGSVSCDEISYVVNLYNDRSGLPTSEANAVIQTSDGYIWIGSYGGLIRYDGTDFINYTEKGGFPSSSVRALYEDPEGNLWIGTNDKGVFRYNGSEFIQIENPDNLFLCVRYICQMPDGSMVICGNEGIAFIEDDVLHAFLNTGVYGKTVYSAGVDSLGRLWLATDDGLTVIKDKTIQGMLAGDFFFPGGDEYSYCIASDDEGNLYIGSNKNSLVKVSVCTEALKEESFDVVTYQLDIGSHNNITIAEDGTICVGGLTGAALISEDGAIKSFSLSEYAQAISYMIKDDQNCLWLASSDLGLVKYSRGPVSVPESDDGFLESIAINTIVLAEGDYYLGYDDGLLIYDSEWNRVNAAEKEELLTLLQGHRVRHIILDNEGNLWIAALDLGVVFYDPKTEKITEYTPDDGLSGDQTRTLLLLSDGSIAVGGREGVDIIRDGRIEEHFGSEDGMENTIILSMLESSDGSLLAGTDGKGIYAFKNGTVSHYGIDEGLTDGVILRMAEDEDGLFISAGSNLYYSDLETFTLLENYDKDSGSILDLFIRDDVLYLLQNSGLLRVDKEALIDGEDASTVLYSFDQGLSGSLIANTWSSIFDDRLYMPTRNGISTFDLDVYDDKLPDGVINYIQLDDSIIFNPTEITVPKNVQRITISFAALNYCMKADCRIAYEIDGFDNSETVLTGRYSETVSYTNLPGGDYSFKFRVYSLIDPANVKSYELTIHKENKLTEMLWFWILLAIAAVAAAVCITFMINKVKLRKAQKSREQYKSIVEDALKTFAHTIDAKDPYTNGHSYHVAMYSRELAKRMGLDSERQEQIYYKALLHDIGKIGIPDDILNKPGKLEPDERMIMEQHVSKGANILKDFKALEGIADGAKYHHERFDGKGYESHISGYDIPLEARIIAVADTYDAMSSDRCYRKALSNEIIREELVKISGSQLDPDIAALMIAMIDENMVPIK